MGRTDAVAFTNQWAARARQLGAVVDFEPGWDTRTNGMAANYEGALVHHTASTSSQANPFPTRNVLINGRSDLQGPLCNVSAPWSPENAPRLVVISARPANHAGASGGKSMGPLPVTGAFNARVFGLEIDYSGNAPMVPGQRRAALIFARAIADVLGRSTEYVRAHAECSITGKWDPGYAPGKTIDMAAFRRDAAALTAPTVQGADMPLTDADVTKIFWGTAFRGTENFAQVIQGMAAQVAGLNTAIATLATAVAANRDDLTADELKQAVRDAIAEATVHVDVNVAGKSA